MMILLDNVSFNAIQAFLISIPESIGLLAFGVGLTATAVIIRWFLGRSGVDSTKEGFRK